MGYRAAASCHKNVPLSPLLLQRRWGLVYGVKTHGPRIARKGDSRATPERARVIRARLDPLRRDIGHAGVTLQASSMQGKNAQPPEAQPWPTKDSLNLFLGVVLISSDTGCTA